MIGWRVSHELGFISKMAIRHYFYVSFFICTANLGLVGAAGLDGMAVGAHRTQRVQADDEVLG